MRQDDSLTVSQTSEVVVDPRRDYRTFLICVAYLILLPIKARAYADRQDRGSGIIEVRSTNTKYGVRLRETTFSFATFIEGSIG